MTRLGVACGPGWGGFYGAGSAARRRVGVPRAASLVLRDVVVSIVPLC